MICFVDVNRPVDCETEVSVEVELSAFTFRVRDSSAVFKRQLVVSRFYQVSAHLLCSETIKEHESKRLWLSVLIQ